MIRVVQIHPRRFLKTVHLLDDTFEGVIDLGSDCNRRLGRVAQFDYVQAGQGWYSITLDIRAGLDISRIRTR